MNEYHLLFEKIENNHAILSDTLVLCCIAEIMTGMSEQRDELFKIFDKKETISRLELKTIIPVSYSSVKYSLEYAINKMNNETEKIISVFFERLIFLSQKLFLFNEIEINRLIRILSQQKFKQHIQKVLTLYNDYQLMLKDLDYGETMQSHKGFICLTVLHFFEIYQNLKEVQPLAQNTQKDKIIWLTQLINDDFNNRSFSIATLEAIDNGLSAITHMRTQLSIGIRPSDLLQNILANHIGSLRFLILKERSMQENC